VAATDSADLLFVGSVFIDNRASGGLGGALYLQNIQGVQVESCEFIRNIAQQSGGGVYFDSCYDVDVNQNSIDGNVVHSHSGGGIFMSASINVSVSNNTISNNTAALGGGGGFYWRASSGMAEPGGRATNEFLNNSALYGDDYATDTATLVYTLSHNDRLLQASSGSTQVYLDTFNEEIDYTVQLHDIYGNVVANQDAFLTVSVDDSFSCGDETAFVTGKTVAESYSGLAGFHFASHCNPSGNVNLSISASGLDAVQDLSLQINLRGCRRGEYYSAGSCYECADGTYSLEMNDNLTITGCSECPNHAPCRGSVLSVDSGYWRLSDNTSFVFECPIAAACLGEWQR
jgi:parallel beta-helix repeat protein